MIAEARAHRVHLLLAAAAGTGELDGASGEALRATLARAELCEPIRRRALQRIFASLEPAGVRALVLKGAGLAYTAYSAAHLRPREDVDVLISRADLERADGALLESGWERCVEPNAELASSQRHYRLTGPHGLAEQLDLHWKISNVQLFGDAVQAEDLLTRATKVAALGASVRTLSAVDALYVACLHRVAHHRDAADLLWLWDIHLLTTCLSEDDRRTLVERADRSSMCGVCARGLELALTCFHTPHAADLVARLRAANGARREPSAGFLGRRVRQVDVLWSDVAALPGWRARASLVREHLFPPVAYMRSHYANWPAVVLPLAYLQRIVVGAPKWFRRSGPGALL